MRTEAQEPQNAKANFQPFRVDVQLHYLLKKP